MCKQNLEPSLLFPLKRFLVRIELLENLLIAFIVVRHLDILPDNREAIIPSSILSAMINRLFRRYL